MTGLNTLSQNEENKFAYSSSLTDASSYLSNKGNFAEHIIKLKNNYKSDVRGPNPTIAKLVILYQQTVRIKAYYDSISYTDLQITKDQELLLQEIEELGVTKISEEQIKKFNDRGMQYTMKPEEELALTMSIQK